MAKLLVIRFSALGDVAMTIPVVYSFARCHPEHEVLFVSRAAFAGMFVQPPSNLRFVGVDLKKKYAGLWGIWKLYRRLASERIDEVIDLHDVLRTKVLTTLFRCAGKRVSAIDKGRREKRKLITDKEARRPLMSSFKRYHQTFARLGYHFPLSFVSLMEKNRPLSFSLEGIETDRVHEKWVGIAPFAAHEGKIFPIGRMEDTIRLLNDRLSIRIFLFGGGAKEKEVLERWENQFHRVHSMAGKLKMEQELELMNQLDLMISMDSGNMHLASLVATPVISIWGATHPYAGFLGWNQSSDNIVSVDLDCRPCSIYGNKPCKRGDYACLYGITARRIADLVEQRLNTPNPM